MSVDKLSIVPLIVWCKIGRIFPDGHSYFRTNKGSFRNSGPRRRAGCKRRRLKSRMTYSRLMLLPHPRVNASPPGTPPRPSAGAPYGKRLSAVRIEFANGFGTAKAGSAVPISPHSPGSSSHCRSSGPSGHFRSPEPSSHFRSHGPSSHFRNPEPSSSESSSHFLSPEPSSHFCSPGPQCQSHAAQKTGPILYRRLLQTGYRTLSVPQ